MRIIARSLAPPRSDEPDEDVLDVLDVVDELDANRRRARKDATRRREL